MEQAVHQPADKSLRREESRHRRMPHGLEWHLLSFQTPSAISAFFWTHQMGHQDIDKEIAHLEVVFGLISTRDRFPLSYWHQRLRALHRESMMPSQRLRIARLEATLRLLREEEETTRTERQRDSTATQR
jgi:hypothetical protein